MSKFVVGYINWFQHDLVLEIIPAETWSEAVVKHSKYPWREYPDDAPSMASPKAFQKGCFDCDCMMNWIEVPNV